MKLVRDNTRSASFHGNSGGGSVVQDALSASDHRVPSSGQVLDNKICQGCGYDFRRPRGSTDKYCRSCHSKPMFEEKNSGMFLIH
ncbi:MAG: hypothetical protein M3P27_03000 [Acidobacteriota bacterium]|nr:hypothetical protein [Acidobacteriota bacterium]